MGAKGMPGLDHRLARALLSDSPIPKAPSWSYLAGMVVGLTVAIGLMALADRRTRRRAEAELPADDVFED